MKKYWILPVLFFAIICFPVLLMAQEIEKSEIIERIDGKKYYIHHVEQGNTLYSLSKVYEVPVDELIFENPDATDGLAIGQLLRIPLVSREKEISDDLRQGDFRYIFHIVKKGQTLYGISQIYNVELDDLKRTNPEWNKGLSVGQYLKIPLKEPAPDQDRRIDNKDDDQYAHTIKTQPKYFEHTVAGQETLYGIARKYRISIDSLYAYNPDLSEKIFPGEVIRIPARLNADNYITHTVTEKTKLKKVASKYALSIGVMKEANPKTRSRVSPGDRLRIPVGPLPDEVPEGIYAGSIKTDDGQPTVSMNDSIRCYERMFEDNREIKVALMIPLYTEETREINIHKNTGSLDPSDYKPFNFIHFYEGFILALEDLESQGLKVRLYVYDVDEKVSKTIKVLQEPELTSMDLIIGPFFSRNFKLVSNFAEMFDIKIVNPLTRRNEVLRSSNVFKMKPSRDAQYPVLAKFVEKYHKGSNIILVRNNKFQYAEDIKVIKSTLDKVIPYGVKISNDKIFGLMKDYSRSDTNIRRGELYDVLNIENRQLMTGRIQENIGDSTFFSNGIAEVVYASDSIQGIIRNASIARNNLVIVLSDNEIFAPEILTRLNDLKDTFDITVVGMPEWELFNNLETDYLLDLNVYFFSDSYYDYDAPEVNDFIEAFRRRYKTHPGNYAFEGHDLASFFLGAMMRFGEDCDRCLPYYEQKLLKTNVKFAPAFPAGYENLFWNLCRYKNYKVVKVSLD